MRAIQPIGTPDCTVSVPGSKSITNRGLLIGALARGDTVLHGALLAEDTVRLAAALRKLGFYVEESPDEPSLLVRGEGGRIPAHAGSLHVGSSGTALRLLTAFLTLAPGVYEVDGDPGLRRRPVGALCAALESMGADVNCSEDGFAPVLIRGREVLGGNVEVQGDVSSQFASGLLLIGPYLPYGLKLRVKGDLVSSPYLKLTAEVMRHFGAEVSRGDDRTYEVRPGAYQGGDLAVEGDATAASYFFAAAAVTGGRVRVRNIARDSLQGDLGLLTILEAMGCTVTRGDEWAEVRGGRLRAVDVNLRDTPDLLPTVAALALVVPGRTRIRGVTHARVKESDRIQAVLSAIRALNGKARVLSDGISVEGGKYGAGAVDPSGDHRIAMAFSILGLRRPGVRILESDCVGKSFPDFFARLAEIN